MSPTQRSLARLRANGWLAQVVEKWIATPGAKKGPPGRRIDLFGVIDIVALDDEPGCLGVQATSTSNQPSRIDKSLDTPALREWLKRGNRFEVWGWAKRKPRGAKRETWKLRRVDIVLEGQSLIARLREGA
jgi:hypothetical protein